MAARAKPAITAADLDLIEDAAAILDGEALALRHAHTLPSNRDVWKDKTEQRLYNEWKDTIRKLYALASRLRRAAKARG